MCPIYKVAPILTTDQGRDDSVNAGTISGNCFIRGGVTFLAPRRSRKQDLEDLPGRRCDPHAASCAFANSSRDQLHAEDVFGAPDIYPTHGGMTSPLAARPQPASRGDSPATMMVTMRGLGRATSGSKRLSHRWLSSSVSFTAVHLNPLHSAPVVETFFGDGANGDLVAAPEPRTLCAGGVLGTVPSRCGPSERGSSLTHRSASPHPPCPCGCIRNLSARGLWTKVQSDAA
jgi:hypothetical protein